MTEIIKFPSLEAEGTKETEEQAAVAPPQKEGIEITTDKAPEYSNMLQNKGVNAFIAVSTKSFNKINPFSNKTTAKARGVTFILSEYKEINEQTKMMLAYILLAISKKFPRNCEDLNILDKYRSITFTVDDFMKLRGLSDVKEAKKQIRETIDALYNISMSWEGERTYRGGKKVKKTFKMYIFSTKEENWTYDENNIIINGNVTLLLNLDMAKDLVRAPVMPFPLQLLKINPHKNPYSYALGYKIAEHHNMNFKKKNSNLISVQSLLAVCPNLPKYEDLKEKRVYQQIIAPFTRDMDALCENPKIQTLTEWTYQHAKTGLPLTDAEQANMSYSDFIGYNISFKCKDYPDNEQNERLERKKAEIARKRKATIERNKRKAQENTKKSDMTCKKGDSTQQPPEKTGDKKQQQTTEARKAAAEKQRQIREQYKKEHAQGADT